MTQATRLKIILILGPVPSTEFRSGCGYDRRLGCSHNIWKVLPECIITHSKTTRNGHVIYPPTSLSAERAGDYEGSHHYLLSTSHSNPIQSYQPASKLTSLQGSRIQASSRQASWHPGIQASKHPSLQACRIGVYHLPLAAAAQALRLLQGDKPSITGIHEIHLNPFKATQMHVNPFRPS